MRTLLLSFDAEKFPSEEVGKKVSEGKAFLAGEHGLREVLEMLESAGCSSTFFVTADFAERFPKTVRQLVSAGHELALHGASHEHAYHSMDETEARRVLLQARLRMRKRFRSEVNGFRGPRMSRPAYRVLRECGFSYDSSLHPTFIPGLYYNLMAPRTVNEEDGIIVMPVSVTPLVRLPFSWLWFRKLGLGYAKACGRLSLLGSDFVHVYFHPWEFVKPPCRPQGLWQGLVFGGSGKDNLERLRRFILWGKGRGMAPATISDFLRLED